MQEKKKRLVKKVHTGRYSSVHVYEKGTKMRLPSAVLGSADQYCNKTSVHVLYKLVHVIMGQLNEAGAYS